MSRLAAIGRGAMAALLTIAGIFKIGFGGLFVLQGAGIVRWPSNSFMIDRSGWIVGGVLIMIVGVGSLLAAARYRSPNAGKLNTNRAP